VATADLMHPRLRNGAATRLAALGPRSRGRAIAPPPRAGIVNRAAWRTSGSARQQSTGDRGAVHQLGASTRLSGTALADRGPVGLAAAGLVHLWCERGPAARIPAPGPPSLGRSPPRRGRDAERQDWFGLAAGGAADSYSPCVPRAAIVTRADWRTLRSARRQPQETAKWSTSLRRTRTRHSPRPSAVVEERRRAAVVSAGFRGRLHGNRPMDRLGFGRVFPRARKGASFGAGMEQYRNDCRLRKLFGSRLSMDTHRPWWPCTLALQSYCFQQ
jgi:hypothetical protein